MKLSTAIILLLVLGIGISFLSTTFAGASAGSFSTSAINTGDTAWVLVSAAFVMLMTPAVGFFYGGMVKSKNIVSVLKQSFMILALVSIQWILIGYTLVFGKDIYGIIGGLNFVGLKGVGFAPNPEYAATIPHLLFMLFQGMFAIITPALIIGAVVGRIQFKTLVIFTLLWTTLVYDPVGHWVWGVGGWLRNLGALDFAGGTVVHITAGFSALAAAMLVGKRKQRKVEPHNIPFILLGAGLLWFGWFGFNAGSALGATPLAVNAFVVTNIAAAAAALTWMLLSYAEHKKPSAIATATGAVCGLVAITPASGFVGPMAALAIGVLAGVVTYVVLLVRTKKINVDDTLDVWAAHGMGGLCGALLTGVFAEKIINSSGNNGVFFGNPQLLVTQIVAVLVVAAYSFIMTIIILKVLSLKFALRVSHTDEKQGLDVSIHGEPGYIFS
jgi:Amt family ammonium transporter